METSSPDYEQSHAWAPLVGYSRSADTPRKGREMTKWCRTEPLSDAILWEAAGPALNIDTIPQALKTYEWQGQNFEQAWQNRIGFERQVKDALARDSVDDVLTAARTIHHWGFDTQRLPRACEEPEWVQTFYSAMQSWRRFSALTDPAARHLEALLATPGLGIARISKWICFIDQRSFGIYDSRVARALRHIQIDGSRLFPIVPDRSENRTWSRPDLTSTERDCAVMASAYLHYLRLLALLGKRVDLPAAQVEMALFMMGKNLPPKGEARMRFNKSIYAPLRQRPDI